MNFCPSPDDKNVLYAIFSLYLKPTVYIFTHLEPTKYVSVGHEVHLVTCISHVAQLLSHFRQVLLNTDEDASVPKVINCLVYPGAHILQVARS
jgi:hypothetical protein